jgi:hypothetical protein
MPISGPLVSGNCGFGSYLRVCSSQQKDDWLLR